MAEGGAGDRHYAAARLAEMVAEVRNYSAQPENADIRRQLLETVAILEQVINHMAKPRRG